MPLYPRGLVGHVVKLGRGQQAHTVDDLGRRERGDFSKGRVAAYAAHASLDKICYQYYRGRITGPKLAGTRLTALSVIYNVGEASLMADRAVVVRDRPAPSKPNCLCLWPIPDNATTPGSSDGGVSRWGNLG